MKRLILMVVLFPVFILSQTKGKVIKISDGDTITVLLKGKEQKKLRLAEVDCPEKGQAFGKNARQFTSDKVFGKTITFIETDKDRYGRSIAKVYYDKGKYLSEELIRAGLGWWYWAFSKNSSLGELQNKAQYQKVGLWQDVHAVAPWEYRKIKRDFNKKAMHGNEIKGLK